MVHLRKPGLFLRQGIDLHSPSKEPLLYYTVVHITGPIFI